MLRTWLLYYTSKMITMSFSKRKYVSVYKGKDGIFEKLKKRMLRWDGWMTFLCELSYWRLVLLWLSKKVGRYPSYHN